MTRSVVHIQRWHRDAGTCSGIFWTDSSFFIVMITNITIISLIIIPIVI